MGWMIDLCGFWMPCGLFLLLLFCLLFPSLCPYPQDWSSGSWYLPCSFYVSVHSALKASPSLLTTHNSSYRICTNNTLAQPLDPDPLSSLTNLNTPWLGWNTRPRSHLPLSLRLVQPRLRFDSFPSPGCRVLPGYCWPAGVWLGEFWLYLDAWTGSVVQVLRNYCPCTWSYRICSESTLYSPGNQRFSGQSQLTCHPASPVDKQKKREKEQKKSVTMLPSNTELCCCKYGKLCLSCS